MKYIAELDDTVRGDDGGLPEGTIKAIAFKNRVGVVAFVNARGGVGLFYKSVCGLHGELKNQKGRR